MFRSQNFRPLLPGVLAVSVLCNSCNKPSAAMTTELKNLRTEVEELRAEKEKTGEVKRRIEIENQALKGAVDKQQDIKTKADAVEREAEDLRKQLDELKKANAELQRKALSRIREKAANETVAVLECPNGRVYRDVVIRSVTEYAVSFRHEGGSASVRFDTAPSMWVKRFGLVPEEAPKPPVIAAAGNPQPAAPQSLIVVAPEPAPAPTADPAAVAPATPAAPAIPQEELIALGRKLMPTVVIIKGSGSEGSGFFAKDDTGTYLYTAAHVICGNTKLEVQTSDGRIFTKFGAMDVAENVDMVRFAMLEEVPAAATLAQNGDNAIGSSVFAMGNSGGGGVLTMLTGTVKGVGAGELEVDAAVIQGNSGGPVFSAPSGRVLGVVTHLMAARQDVWAADTPFADVRRFAARVDGQIRWRRVPVATLVNEPTVIAEYTRVTRLLFALSALTPTTAGLRLTGKVGSGAGVSAMSILAENENMEPVKELIKMNQTLGGKAVKTSEKDLLKKFASFYSSILSSAKRQSATFKPASFASCNRKLAEANIEWRALAEKEIEGKLQEMNR